jgi:hypothetical protein
MNRSRMSATVIGFCLALACTAAAAAFFDGYKLKEWFDAEARVENGNPQLADRADASYLIGYIAGVHDVFVEIAFCPPPTAKLGQLMGVVQKHLIANPEEWHKPAALISAEALKQAFPCK